MTGRLAHLVAALGVALLAAAALRTLHAELAYVAGLARANDPQANPSADVDGRLADYEEAVRRDPGEALYRLRAAQIHLRRAGASLGAAQAEEVAAARELLGGAVRVRPLDAAVHATLAQADRFAGDPAAAVRSARLAVRLAPRAPGVLGTAISVGLWAWTSERDPSSLRLALAGGAGFASIGRTGIPEAFRTAFAQAGPDLAADLLEASAGDAALRAFAAEAVRPVRPLVADALDEFGPTGPLPR